MTSFKILIVGGGIAGSAAAYWMSRIDGAHVTLIERSSEMRASGQQLDLRAQGVDVMKKMGIETRLRANLVREPGLRLIDTDGNPRAYFPAADPGSKRQSITSEFEIMRGKLVQILYSLTEDSSNVRHLYNSTIKTFTQDEEGDPNGKVHVTFSDGRQEDYDLLVAADGTASKTRKIMLGPDAPDPRHRTGGYIAYFSAPAHSEDSDWMTSCLFPGDRMRRTIMTRKDCKELTRIYMMLSKRDEAIDAAQQSGDLSALKKALANVYEGAGWEAPRFMDALLNAPEADDLYCTAYEEVRLPEGSWSKGRVVLLGDAAHSGTANGYGTSWAMVGSYLLAGELATEFEKEGSKTTASIVRAAKTYEKIFRPIALSGHGGSEESLIGMPHSPFWIEVALRFAAVAAWLRVDKWIGFDGFAGRWKLPEYPALDEDNGLDSV
ncbi:hypothetical protein GGR57DRAFT_480168 [Xylariaceae sp. FL1272]|nr:hypothetical protein GGR57DRAFT_480168 [Xylariaceae sp. FL1272]